MLEPETFKTRRVGGCGGEGSGHGHGAFTSQQSSSYAFLGMLEPETFKTRRVGGCGGEGSGHGHGAFTSQPSSSYAFWACWSLKPSKRVALEGVEGRAVASLHFATEQ